MPTLDLYDVTGDAPVRLDSVTMDGNGKLAYEGKLIKDMWSTYLRMAPPREVFKNFTGWSNGYSAMRLKGE
jgi:hypothetical protein